MLERKSAAEQPQSKTAQIFARAFRERELLLRSGGQVRFLRLTTKLQIGLISVVLAFMLWASGATLLSWVELDRIAAADARLKDSRVAYDDLLEEIAIYQRKVAEVTGKLKQNQSELIRRFARADALEQDNGAGGSADANASNRLAAITESRDAMHQHLRQLDVELREMTDLDDVLAASLNSIQHDLVTAVAERKKVYQARANLKKQVWVLQEKLQSTRGSVSVLESKIADLTGSLKSASGEIERVEAVRDQFAVGHSNLEQLLEEAASREASLQMKTAELRADLASAEGDYDRVSSQRADLEVQTAALHGALRAEEDRADGLEADLKRFAQHLASETGDSVLHNPVKETLSDRVGVLLARLTDIHHAKSQVIQNLKSLTVGDIADAERILGMTGLDVDKLLTTVDAHEELGQGGPFVALAGGAAQDSLAGAVHGLDSRLTRLESLRVALQAVPLVSPVDTYRVASRFGKRRDPISKKWAIHSGVDLASHSKTRIYAAAPGIVTKAGWKGRYGRMIEIDHGFGIRTRYGHLRKIYVKKGQEVRHRDKIALLGSSGRSTGPHLHYEILYGNIAMDPMKFIQAGKHVFKE